MPAAATATALAPYKWDWPEATIRLQQQQQQQQQCNSSTMPKAAQWPSWDLQGAFYQQLVLCISCLFQTPCLSCFA
jgi:hypothetical protein